MMLSCALALSLTLPLVVTSADIESAWSQQTKVGPDAAAGGWFVNLGITGARAKITKESPRALEIAYVFEDTPAHRKLAVGDKIVGVNGEPFCISHRFGYGMKVFGYSGPLKEFGDALEASQGTKALKGKLRLTVERGDETKTIELRLPTRDGAFGADYPFDCKKSERVLDECYAFLLDRQRGDGLWHGRVHLNALSMLALLGSPDRKHQKAAAKAAKAMGRNTRAELGDGGHPNWKYGLYGVALGEFYLKTNERWALDELREIYTWLTLSQAPDGGFGHKPYEANGSNGYGSINMITAQILAAFSLMERCGIEVDPARVSTASAFIVRGTNRQGYVWYKDGNGGAGYADMGRTGASAVAHMLSPSGGDAFTSQAQSNARCIGTHTDTFPDTHGSPIVGLAWTALGALVEPEPRSARCSTTTAGSSRCPALRTVTSSTSRTGTTTPQDWHGRAAAVGDRRHGVDPVGEVPGAC